MSLVGLYDDADSEIRFMPWDMDVLPFVLERIREGDEV
jgi:hypothetical protein